MKTFISVKRFQFYLWVGVAWLLLWIFNAFLNNSETLVPQSLNEIWRFFYIVAVNLIFFEYSLPIIRRKRSMILFNIMAGILLVTLHLILISVGLWAWKCLGALLHIYTSLRQVTLIPDGLYYRIVEDVLYQAQGGISSTIFFGIAKLLYDNFRLSQTTQQLRLEKQEAELNYLKAQTNPHFLFNTLNNIYSLAKDKSDMAPESILRLSKILRFMLYETSGEFISIGQELEIISDYMALEKLRYDDSLRIIFKHEIEDLKQPLPPLLLIPLVENAFKHGVSETRNQPFIDIHLSANQQQLLVVIKNSTEIFHGEKSVKENIGLSNLRRQLELLYTDYDLSVQQNENVFIATLKINLASHV
jgi:two-component system, LytTR family, sensor kinase